MTLTFLSNKEESKKGVCSGSVVDSCRNRTFPQVYPHMPKVKNETKDDIIHHNLLNKMVFYIELALVRK
jgi:hypothetical protein